MCRLIGFALLLSCACHPLFGGSSLRDVLALTLLNNPELNSFSYDQRAAEARILQASLRPNPALDIETENINQTNEIQTTLLLSQSLELGEKRRARLQFAGKERDRVALEYEIKKRQVFLDTTLLFIDLLVNGQKVGLLNEEVQTLREFSDRLDKRIEAGRASAIEVANFKNLAANATIDLQKAQNDWNNSKAKLAAQWGETRADSVDIVGSLQQTPAVAPLAELQERLQENPQMVFFSMENQVREAKYAVEKSKAIPDVNVRGGPRYLNDVQKWVWVVGISIPLPIMDRNQGNRWEAVELWEKLEKERQAIWLKLQTDLSNAYATLQTIAEELRLLNTSLPFAKTAFEESLKGYHQGRYTYLELLEAGRSFRSARMRYLQALGDYHKTLAKLESLAGSPSSMIFPTCELK